MTLTTWRWYNNNTPTQAIRPIIQPSLHTSILWKFIQPSPVATRLTHHGCARWSKLCDYDDNIQRFGWGGTEEKTKAFISHFMQINSMLRALQIRNLPGPGQSIDSLTDRFTGRVSVWPLKRRNTNKVGTRRTLLQHFVKHSVPIAIKTIIIMLDFSSVQVFEV